MLSLMDHCVHSVMCNYFNEQKEALGFKGGEIIPKYACLVLWDHMQCFFSQ